MNLYPSMDRDRDTLIYEAEAAMEADDDHPPGERFPLVWSVTIIGIACAMIWVVIWLAGQW